MSSAVVKFVPGTVSTVGQGAQALGIKLTKNQAITRLVNYAVRKVAPGLHPEIHKHAVNFLATAVDSLLKAGQKVDANVLIEHAKRGLPSFLQGLKRVPLPSVPTMSITGRNRGYKQSTTNIAPGGYPVGGVTAAPVSISRNINRKSKPKIQYRGDGVVISHSEMLGAINSGAPTSNVTAFRSVGFRSNPGMANIFPWLSSMAVNFEKYRFKSLSFTLVPLVSTAFNGRIGVGFDYDSSDAAPGNRQEFYALSTHCENMPWQGCTVRIKCDGLMRFTGTHVAADNKLIDLGQVVVMSDSVSNGGTIAAAIPLYDLIVDYTVELIEPQQALFASQLFSTTANLTSGVPLGTGSDLTGIYGPSVVVSTSVTNQVLTFNLPAGVFWVSYHFNWTSGTAATAITVPTTGAGLKSNNTNTGSDSIGIAVVTSPVECSLVFTASGTAWNANLFRLMVCVSRVASQLNAQYFT